MPDDVDPLEPVTAGESTLEEIPPAQRTPVTGVLVGPSGAGRRPSCGPSTVSTTTPGGRSRGRVTVGDLDVYARDTQPELVRSRVGMVFQRPNPFPTMSIFDNVVAGLRLNGSEALWRRPRRRCTMPPCGTW